MRTARSLTVSRSIQLGGGFCPTKPLDADSHGGRPPPPVNRMTHRCKSITLPQTSFAGGNKKAFRKDVYCPLADHVWWPPLGVSGDWGWGVGGGLTHPLDNPPTPIHTPQGTSDQRYSPLPKGHGTRYTHPSWTEWLTDACENITFLRWWAVNINEAKLKAFFLIFTARKWSLGQGNIFTGVCLSKELRGSPWTETPPYKDPPPPFGQIPPHSSCTVKSRRYACILV